MPKDRVQDDYRKRLAETHRGANITELFAMIRILLTEMSGDAGGLELFARLFTVILPDNGTEFSAPSRIETDEVGNRLMRIYFDKCPRITMCADSNGMQSVFSDLRNDGLWPTAHTKAHLPS